MSDRSFLSSPEELIDEARNGRMFILADDEDRENEGDLVIPAQMATPDAINFMAKHGRGLICLALTAGRCDELRAAGQSDEDIERRFTESDANKDGKITAEEFAPDPRLQKGLSNNDLGGDGTIDERDWNFYRARRASRNALLAVRTSGLGDRAFVSVIIRNAATGADSSASQ